MAIEQKFPPEIIPLPKMRGEETLATVREEMRVLMAVGEAVTCPCCSQTAKVYSRPINAAMVAALSVVARSTGGLNNRGIVSAMGKSDGASQISKLVHWGLVEQDREHNWCVTSKGRLFLAGRIKIPARILIYNNLFLGFDERDHVDVLDVAGVEFSLAEVLDPDAVATARARVWA